MARFVGKLFCLSLYFFTAVGFCFSEGSKSKTVKVGYYENEVFQEGAAADSVKKGYAYEYYRKLSEYTGWKYEYVYGSYAELYDKLLAGEIDLLAGLAYKKEREGLLLYPDEAMGSESLSLVKHDDDSSITPNYQSLNGRSIGVLNSALADTLKDFLINHNIKAVIKKFNDYADLFKSFDSKQVDVLVAEGDGAYRRKHAEFLCVFGKVDYYLCVNINRPDILEALNVAQNLLIAEEPYFQSNLNAKYYSVSVSSNFFSDFEKKWLSENNSLRVGYLNNYMPYSDSDKKGNVSGIVSDLISGIEDRLGIKDFGTTYTGYDTYDDMIRSINEGETDIIFPVSGEIYFSEENGIYQSNPVVSGFTELVFLENPEMTDEKVFAVNKRNRMHYFFTKTRFPNNKIVFYDSIDDCLDAVLSKKVDFTTINGYRIEILRNSKYSSLFSVQIHTVDDKCFGIRIGNEGLLKLINRGINIIGKEYIQNAIYKYSKELYKYTWKDFFKDNLVFVVLIFVVIFGVLVLSLLRDMKHSRDALKAAENSNYAKTLFLNNMSHDIRTPINAIVGFTELTKTHLDDKKIASDYLNKISISSRHLLSLINDVLDMSRIESGKFSIDKTEVNLIHLIEDLQIITQTSFEEKEHTFKVDTSKIVHQFIITDKLRLNQVLMNIISNAIKFTDSGGEISLSVEEKPMGNSLDAAEKFRNGALFEFRIKDNGIGISDEFKEKIFEAFTREDNDCVNRTQGTGLGMAITKNIVTLLGGTITFESKIGEGSEFVVQIPCEIKKNNNFVERKKAEPERFDFTGKRVLLVEDNEMNLVIAEENLKNVGFFVDVARDGVEAVENVLVNPEKYYDVILMDIQMPKMDGYEATRKIRILEKKYAATVPIIAVTANAFEDDRAKSLAAGMNAHLSKPYDIPVMFKTISSLIK